MDKVEQAERQYRDCVIATWLLAIVALVFGMILLGGLTRLTGSGLSMVHWEPLSGWIPPISEEDWNAVFEAYKRFPEYAAYNAGMSLDGFKEIFWLEFLHRLLGRLIGVVFFVPFLIFLVRGWLGWRLAPKLAALFLLGGAQGVLGWYMVMSGLSERADVSQYRLVAHLALGAFIMAIILWTALSLLISRQELEPRGKGVVLLSRVVLLLVAITILAGGFTAGTGAGSAFNTYPLMDGALIPDGLYGFDPSWMSPFEDQKTIQFNHRHLAELTTLMVLVMWFAGRRSGIAGRGRAALNLMMVISVIQICLGIFTLLMVVPIWLAVMHQAGAMALLCAAVWTAFEFRSVPVSKTELRASEAGPRPAFQ